MGLFAIWNDSKAHIHKLISTKILTQFLPVVYSVWLPTSYVAITATGDFPFWGGKLIAPLLAYTKLGRNFLVYIAALAKEQIHSTINWYTVHFCTKWTLYLVLIMLWGAKMQNFRLPKVLALPYSMMTCTALMCDQFVVFHTKWRHTTANLRYWTVAGLG